jgi:atypical dual specificity phosphatase
MRWTLHARMFLTYTSLRVDRGTWLTEGQVLGCAYPRADAALAALQAQAITLLVNLHERAHDAARLARYDLREIHLPVPDFTAPSPEQLRRGVAAVTTSVARGERVAVHCGAGLGRTGTLLACYLVQQGHSTDGAISRVRAARPGSVETRSQETAVRDFARRYGCESLARER